MLATHLSTATSDLPEYISKNARNVSLIQVGDGTKVDNGVYNRYGSMNTRHIPSWKSPPLKDQKLVIDERKRQGIIYREKNGAKYGKLGNSNHVSPDSNCFKKLKEHNQKYEKKY